MTLVGATLGAVVVGVVTAFDDFPTDTIIWTIFAIAYQQFENYVVQPRIQGRAVQLDPFLVVVAALFGAALLGVLGAILAIPCAAAIQIGVREALKAEPDGYTLLVGAMGMVVLGYAMEVNPPFDALRDLSPIAGTAEYATPWSSTTRR